VLLGYWLRPPFYYYFFFDKKNNLIFFLGDFFSLFFYFSSGIECGRDGGEEADSSSMTERIEGGWIHSMNMGGCFVLSLAVLRLLDLRVGWRFSSLSSCLSNLCFSFYLRLVEFLFQISHYISFDILFFC